VTTDHAIDPDRLAPMPSTDGFEPILRGRLVYLRPAERDDVPVFVRWLSDARTTGYLAAHSPISLAMEERWFEDLLDHHGQDRWFFVICRLEDDRAVGSLDLREIGPTSGGAGLGIVIGDPADTGHGYGTDALEVLLDFGFGELRLERMWLEVFDFNERALHVYRRLGFVHEATFRHAIFHGGRHLDLQRHGILREEWAERRQAATT
jgi:RimJ/RimL family protein N-acetyltransferase